MGKQAATLDVNSVGVLDWFPLGLDGVAHV